MSKLTKLKIFVAKQNNDAIKSGLIKKSLKNMTEIVFPVNIAWIKLRFFIN